MPARVHAGPLLREWRTRRRLSQLDLSTRTGVSTRHLSCVETGRAKPSRELLLHLALDLDIPRRSTNDLLLAAGFAPVFSEFSLDDDEMSHVKDVIRLVLDGNAPNPTTVIDTRWNLIDANAPALWLCSEVDPHLLEWPINVARLSLHPDGLARQITNFDAFAGQLISHMRHTLAATHDPLLAALVEECARLAPATFPSQVDGADVVLPMNIERAGRCQHLGDDSITVEPGDEALSSRFVPRTVDLDEPFGPVGEIPAWDAVGAALHRRDDSGGLLVVDSRSGESDESARVRRHQSQTPVGRERIVPAVDRDGLTELGGCRFDTVRLGLQSEQDVAIGVSEHLCECRCGDASRLGSRSNRCSGRRDRCCREQQRNVINGGGSGRGGGPCIESVLRCRSGRRTAFPTTSTRSPSVVDPDRCCTTSVGGSYDFTSGLSSSTEMTSDEPFATLTGVIDGHNDLPWAMRRLFGCDLVAADLSGFVPAVHTDIPRLRSGGVSGQFWSVYVPSTLPGPIAVSTTLEQIDFVHRMIERYPDDLALALDVDGVESAAGEGRIASMLGMEGGHSINESLPVLRVMFDLGVRYMTLTHNHNVAWADSATDTRVLGGMNDFGREVVREMNRIGMIVDLSHVSTDVMHQALATSTRPVMFSHSSARSLCDVERNVPDDVLRSLATNGGICMVAFVPDFVSPAFARWFDECQEIVAAEGGDPRLSADVDRVIERRTRTDPPPHVTADDIADHIEHVRDVAGVDHVGIGGDYGGSTLMPTDLHDVSTYPVLFDTLISRGWSVSDLDRLRRVNVLRVMGDNKASSRT